MDAARIADLINPYVVGLELPPSIYEQLNTYLDLLLRWNVRTNLTSIRDSEQIVTRHFGESLFAAKVLSGYIARVPHPTGREAEVGWKTKGAPHIPSVGMCGNEEPTDHRPSTTAHCLADLGSGAGFPGLPIKLAIPTLQVTLIESQNKKATFLKEVIRALKLERIEVYNGRAEQWGKTVDIVTMRAVEKFESTLAVARRLLRPDGCLCLLTTSSAARAMSSEQPDLWMEHRIPETTDSVVMVGIDAAK